MAKSVSVFGFLMSVITCSFSTIAWGQERTVVPELDSLRANMACYKSRKCPCPTEEEFTTLDLNEVCAHLSSVALSSCQNRVIAYNNLLNEYRHDVDDCRKIGNRGDRPLSDRLNRARKKAEDADRINKLDRERWEEKWRRDAAAAYAAKKRAAEAADAAKWKCYGSANKVRAGFVLCSVRCRDYYDYNFCDGQCKSGGKSALHGQSCFKVP
jgi:hypothetical protein